MMLVHIRQLVASPVLLLYWASATSTNNSPLDKPEVIAPVPAVLPVLLLSNHLLMPLMIMPPLPTVSVAPLPTEKSAPCFSELMVPLTLTWVVAAWAVLFQF